MKQALLSAAAASLAATLVAGGVAWATIPATGGVINGCYRVSEDDQKGQVRVVNDAASCKTNEAPIAWNQVGLQGPKGDKGDQGIQGRQGENGTNGRDGANGTDGANGVSVTSAAEPAGSNCATGGSKFTAANGTTYACNGVEGPPGSSALSGYTIVSESFSVGPLSHRHITLECPDSKRPLGGGYSVTENVVSFDLGVGYSRPFGVFGWTGWSVGVWNGHFVDSGLIVVYVICADV